MNDYRSVIWSRGRLTGAVTRPRHPFALALGVAGIVLLIDLLLALALQTGERQDDLYFNGDFQVRQYLAHAVQDPGPAWLLVGDSVLMGDSVRAEIPDWNKRRVIDYMRAGKAPESPAHFYQVALNGLLPVDMLRIVRELDRRDPRGQMGVVLEINRRFFSRAYAEQTACTRPWLENLAPSPLQEGRVNPAAWMKLEQQTFADMLRARLPIFRHRNAFSNPVNGWIAQITAGRARRKAEDPFAVQARMREHFGEVSFDENHQQVRALIEILDRLRGTGRPALLFTPPLKDEQMNSLVSPEQYGEDQSRLARIVARRGAPNVRLVHMDHALFDNTFFKDIAHMFPEGNRLLAINLLQAINIPMAELPKITETIYPEAPNTTLVWNLQPGNANGAPWQAAFRQPGGIDVDARQRVVIADTGNHCLREFLPNLQTVVTLAGQPGNAGCVDGDFDTALLDTPRNPCIAGESVFFSDDSGRRLREVRQGGVTTARPLEGPAWENIQMLRARDTSLYLLDGGHRILTYDTRNLVSRVVVESSGDEYQITAFDIAPDGRIFAADQNNRIWWAAMTARLRLPEDMHVLFANTAPEAVPPASYFPLSFDRIRLEHITDLRYIRRYDGLLAEDVFPENKPVQDLDERVHLRFLGIEDRMVYPWMKTAVSGAYITWNAPAETYVSPVRLGSLAVDQASGEWYQLEQNRSRLIRVGDAMWEIAKIGQTGAQLEGSVSPDMFGNVLGAYILDNRRPERFLNERIESAPRAGPYIGVMFGPSNISSTDIIENYSLGRAMELRLQRRLGLCDGIRLDLIVRSEGGATFYDTLNMFETYVALEGRADVALIALRDALAVDSEDRLSQALAALALAAQRYDIRVLFFDTTGLQGMFHDSLQPRKPTCDRTIELIRKAGFGVIEPSDLLLRESLEIFPFACPPFKSHHAAPWSVEYAAEVIAAGLYPGIKQHLTGRIPARIQPYPEEEPPEDALRKVFDEFDVAWPSQTWVPVDLAARQQRYDGRTLDIFVDLNKVPGGEERFTADRLDAIALSVLYNTLYQDLSGRIATSVSISLAKFSNYDEYGAGVRKNAQILYRRAMDNDALRAYLEEHFPGTHSLPPAGKQEDEFDD